MNLRVIVLAAICAIAAGCGGDGSASGVAPTTQRSDDNPSPRVRRSDADWKKILTADRYDILRRSETETSFKNAYWDNHEKGVYRCAGCNLTLFSSDAKFESGTGWPSFRQAVASDHLLVRKDADGDRNEVACPRCGGHLGHVFNDGPKPAGKRYCINSGALTFENAK